MTVDLRTDTTLKILESLRKGEISSVELFDAMVANIERWNPSVNAVVAMDLERGKAEAAAADAIFASNERLGLLHGLPMTIKDCYETLDLVTTAGAPQYAGHMAERDADVVRLLRRAGAIVWAKTNVPYLAEDHQSFNEVYGRTNNPWDLTRTAGGSSGGAAVAVACGFTTAEVGSDIGSSIRQPSSHNGVFGLKTTFGLVSGRGHIPGPPGALGVSDLGVFGPIARSCGDLRLLLEILTTSPTAFGGVPGGALPRLDEPAEISKLRIGVWSDDPVAPVDSSVKQIIDNVGEDLRNAGAQVEYDLRPDIASEELHHVYITLLMAAMSEGTSDAHWEDMLKRSGGTYGPSDDALVQHARGSTLPHGEWMKFHDRRLLAEAAWNRVFEQVDVVIAPIQPVAAFPHDTERGYHNRTLMVNGAERPYGDILFWAGLATMPHLPAVAVPVGRTAEGLPVGMQVIGPKWSDHRILGISEEIASVLGARFEPPPLVS